MFKLKFKSASDNPHAYNYEYNDRRKWWNNGLNSEEIEIKLANKGKKSFAWKYRYDKIVGMGKHKSMQWKIAFLNPNINSKPQSEIIKKEKIKRFITNLKKDNLFDEVEGELKEYLEFEDLHLSSAKTKSELETKADNNFKIFDSVLHDCWIPLKKLSAKY
jgi:hypothetical protein